jgi:hypothetical protein
LLVFLTVFSLGLSIVQSFNLGCQTSFILSSSHRPLLSLTLVFICWLGEAQWGCCESCIVVCMCAFELPSGGLNRRACCCWVGLVRLSGSMPDFLGFTFPLVVFLVDFCLDGVGCIVTAPGVLRAVGVGLQVMWVDEVKECLGHFICVWVDLVSFLFRFTMTRVMASSEDLDRLGEFLEGARLVFLTVPLGASMAYVNSLFWRLASIGRRTLPAGVWVGVRVRGLYRRSVRLQRWAQRQLLIHREVTVARCVRVVTGSLAI